MESTSELTGPSRMIYRAGRSTENVDEHYDDTTQICDIKRKYEDTKSCRQDECARFELKKRTENGLCFPNRAIAKLCIYSMFIIYIIRFKLFMNPMVVLEFDSNTDETFKCLTSFLI